MPFPSKYGTRALSQGPLSTQAGGSSLAKVSCDARALPPTKTLNNGRYKDLKILTIGGESLVYTAIDSHDGASVCIKEFFPTGCIRDHSTSSVEHGTIEGHKFRDQLAKFETGAARQKFLSHPAILSPLDIFSENKTSYIVSPFIMGGTLRDGVSGIPPEQKREIFFEILAALSSIHDRDLAHGDIKPENILLKKTDGSFHPLLIDFGNSEIALNIRDPRTQALGAVSNWGSPLYAAPEQFLNRPHYKESDIFSAAALLYFIETGEDPLDGHLHSDISQRFPELGTFSGSFAQVFARALSADPKDRFTSAQEFAVALQASTSDSVGMINPAPPPLAVTRVPPPPQRVSRLRPLLVQPPAPVQFGQEKLLIPDLRNLSLTKIELDSPVSPRRPGEPAPVINSFLFYQRMSPFGVELGIIQPRGLALSDMSYVAGEKLAELQKTMERQQPLFLGDMCTPLEGEFLNRRHHFDLLHRIFPLVHGSNNLNEREQLSFLRDNGLTYAHHTVTDIALIFFGMTHAEDLDPFPRRPSGSPFLNAWHPDVGSLPAYDDLFWPKQILGIGSTTVLEFEKGFGQITPYTRSDYFESPYHFNRTELPNGFATASPANGALRIEDDLTLTIQSKMSTVSSYKPFNLIGSYD